MNFLQDFPTSFSRNIFLQQFPARFFCKILRQDFPELHPDWLAPHHPIPNVKFPPITAFLKLAFSHPPCPGRISLMILPQDITTRISHRNFLQQFPIILFQMLNFHQSLPFLNWLFPLLFAIEEFPTKISYKIFLQDFQA